MNDARPTLHSVYLFVRDMGAALAFYRLLGGDIPEGAESQSNVEVAMPGGLGLGFGTYKLTRSYDTGWAAPVGISTNSLQFSLPTRDAVDDFYAGLAEAGYKGHLAPYDAFWGSRYAIVDDPDGNVVGFQSPADEAHRGPAPPDAW